MKLVFATNNLNKLKEVQKMLPKSIDLLSLNAINCAEEIEETETTLEGNAKLKANYISNKYGYNCFADDTGLEVKTLNGAPGVFSARYAGEPANSENNITKLLSTLSNNANRDAQFRTVICLNLNGEQFFFEGICKGEIIKEKKGSLGFGYDPIFKPFGYTTTFSEMSFKEKNTISHRRIAIKKLISFLSNYKQ